MSLISIFIILIFLHRLISSRLERNVLTAPIVLTTAGALALFLRPVKSASWKMMPRSLHYGQSFLHERFFDTESRAEDMRDGGK